MKIYANLAPPPVQTKTKRKKPTSKADQIRKDFEAHLQSPDWEKLLTPMDVVIFFRECYKHVYGKEAARTSLTRWLKVAKNLLTDYGAAETLQIICCSFVTDSPPTDMGWYQTWHLSAMLQPGRYTYTQHEAVPIVAHMKRAFMVSKEREENVVLPPRTYHDQQGSSRERSADCLVHGSY